MDVSHTQHSRRRGGPQRHIDLADLPAADADLETVLTSGPVGAGFHEPHVGFADVATVLTHVPSTLRPQLARLSHGGRGRVSVLCPGSSDVNLLSDRQSVVDLNPEIANCAFDPCMAKPELNGTQIARPPVDQGRLCASEGMGAE